MSATTLSPTPQQEDPQKQLARKPESTAQRQRTADPVAPVAQQAAPGKRRPAPLRLLRAPAAASAPLVVEDDSKPDLGDIGLGLAASSLLRLPGLPA
ncbi:hypothetical protein Rsub_03552 [Raphidocelis subcapitata]|uniref:Uncharacterized protein n=1 Tax=Raphidocelis subcapitata TaxID=307507 RepID=A0A2V0NX25_9CHLO|nr:hypothetical protein Rsub_03552 [Raphidocelis subcapitata]|eukprot:GBF91232.1 hypothetical protein Rsub_03552 [Raphidocelis subcapitata]